MIEAFDFGSNWKHYSARALTTSRVEGAREAFCELTFGIELKSRSFLDVGFGQGLTALCAADAGAAVCCLDVNPRCAEALELTSQFFLPEAKEKLTLIAGSILSSSDVRQLRKNRTVVMMLCTRGGCCITPGICNKLSPTVPVWSSQAVT